MKVKTITCHDVYNLGASLQAYALAEYLSEIGQEVEIIDYKPLYLQHYNLKKVNNPAYDKPVLKELYLLLKLPERLKGRRSKRKKEFDKFRETFLPITNQTYCTNEELKRDVPEADIYFAGSDQIWNTLFKNGKDPAFYLDFAPSESIRASYAASFATEDIVEEEKVNVKKRLEKMDYISVREKSGIEIINQLGIKGAVHVLDPVFLLKQAKWIEIEKKGDFREPYLLVYDFEGNEKIRDFVIRKAKEENLAIYSILSCDYCDRCFEEEGPQMFISLIHHAEYIVSNSFHGTAFAIIFRKPFAVFDRSEKINTRMQDLIKSMCLTNYTELKDYENVEKNIEKQIENSKFYIDCVLKNMKGVSDES